MNKQVMELWVKALRSGKYRKGRNRLCAINKNGTKKWCCLGVLCDLYNEHNDPLKTEWKMDPWVNKSSLYYHHLSGSGGVRCETNNVLPQEVQKWADMSSIQGKFKNKSGVTALSELNDCTKGKRSFKRMADIIEKYWEQL